MMNKTIITILILFVFCHHNTLAARDNRYDIVNAMDQFLTVCWYSGDQGACLDANLEHPNYSVSTCGGYPPDNMYESDFLWHPDFLNGLSSEFSACGMPYCFGGNTFPADLANDACNCKALGAHSCHYYGNNYNVSWATGTDCSAAVCYALDIPRVGTALLDTDEYGVLIDWDDLDVASYIVKANSHVVLVEDNWYGSLSILEATGAYPVSRRVARTAASYLSAGYQPRDAVAVVTGGPVLAVSGRISWSPDGNNVVLSVFTNVQPEDGLELVRQDAYGHDEIVWGVQDFELIQHTGDGSYTFVDQAPVSGPRYYVLRIRYGDSLLDLDKILVPGVIPGNLEFEAFPNPFNPSVNLRIVLPAETELAVDVYDSRGRFVKTLREWAESNGQVDIKWDGLNANGQHAASGMYFVRLRTETQDYFKKVMMLK